MDDILIPSCPELFQRLNPQSQDQDQGCDTLTTARQGMTTLTEAMNTSVQCRLQFIWVYMLLIWVRLRLKNSNSLQYPKWQLTGISYS